MRRPIDRLPVKRLVSTGFSALGHEQRIAAELSQEELARRAHLATATIRKIESRDPPEPRFFTVLDMAEVLGIGSRQFLGLVRDLQRRSDP